MIEQVLSQKTASGEILPDQAIVVGDTVFLKGKQLKGDITRLRLGRQEITPSEVSDTQIKFILDMPPFADKSLRAGVQALQVVQRLSMGTPETEHAGNASNVAPFVLRPAVTAGAVPVSSREANGVMLCTNDITLQFTPPVGVNQRVSLMFNEYNPPAERQARAYRFEVSFTASNPSDTSVVAITTRVADVAAGDYLVRVQVDGAESSLNPGLDPENHPFYCDPIVSIT